MDFSWFFNHSYWELSIFLLLISFQFSFIPIENYWISSAPAASSSNPGIWDSKHHAGWKGPWYGKVCLTEKHWQSAFILGTPPNLSRAPPLLELGTGTWYILANDQLLYPHLWCQLMCQLQMCLSATRNPLQSCDQPPVQWLTGWFFTIELCATAAYSLPRWPYADFRQWNWKTQS